MDGFIIRIMASKLRAALLWGLLGGGLAAALCSKAYVLCYAAGFVTGCCNFIISTLFMHSMLIRQPGKSMEIQGLFFVIRYFLILLSAQGISTGKGISVILFAIGFLTVNYAVIISSYSKGGVAEREW